MAKIVSQCGTEQIKAQQMVLAHLGFYKGKIDGIWSTKSITAKREFEAGNFDPCVPNGGFPFEKRGSLPMGLYWEGTLLRCSGLDLTKYQTPPANQAQQKSNGGDKKQPDSKPVVTEDAQAPQE